MFRGGKTYIHDNFRDVVMFVVKNAWGDSARVKLKVKWFLNNGGFLGDDKVTIKREDFKDWHCLKAIKD